jgi:hypothetical protein
MPVQTSRIELVDFMLDACDELFDYFGKRMRKLVGFLTASNATRAEMVNC